MGIVRTIAAASNQKRSSTQFATISPGTLSNARSASRARSSRFGSLTCGTSRKITARAVTFLTGHYFVPEMAQAVAKQIGRDLIRELSGFPQWAIEAAFEWWLSSRNPNRSRKPMPGDISERARVEAAIIQMGRKQIEFYARYGDNPPSWLRT